MLGQFDHILGEAPEYEQNEMVGFPINAILNWPMGTAAGLTAFVTPKVNDQLKKMFDGWSKFLISAESCHVLRTAGLALLRVRPCLISMYHGFAIRKHRTRGSDPGTPFY